MYLLTNISQDAEGHINAGFPTTFETVDKAIETAKTKLADDFNIGVNEVEKEAQEGGTPYVISMSKDGRLEIYTVAEAPETQMPEKAYGYTLTLSEAGSMSGPAYFTEVFQERNKCIDEAIQCMKMILEQYGYELKGTDMERAFEKKLRAWKDIRISATDPTAEIEFFTERMVDATSIKVETPMGTIIAEVTGGPGEYPGIWICKDTANPYRLIAAVEYVDEKLRVTGYREGINHPHVSYDCEQKKENKENEELTWS